jgi:hypothetical protein
MHVSAPKKLPRHVGEKRGRDALLANAFWGRNAKADVGVFNSKHFDRQSVLTNQVEKPQSQIALTRVLG